MGCLAVSFVLPLLPAPREWSWREEVRVLPATDKGPSVVAAQTVVPASSKLTTEKAQSEMGTTPSRPATTLVRRHRVKQAQVEGAVSSDVRADSRPAGQTDARLTQQVDTRSAQRADTRPVTAPAGAGTDGFRLAPILSLMVRWLFYAYLFGVLLFGFNFLFQLAVMFFQSYASPVIRDGRFRIVETSGNRAPCSFGNTIFINPASYDWETYNQILIHEKTHVSGRHTLDILLAEMALVLQWFNPIAWFYRREVENNLEFLTDAAVLQHQDVERSAYQLSLLRVSAPHLPFGITNNYNQSLLKRRIVMMNSKRSSRYTVWKYLFLLPVFTVLVCALNEPAAYGQRSKKDSARKAATNPDRSADKASPASAASPSPAASSSSAASPVSAVSPASAASPGSASSPASEAKPALPDTTVRPAGSSAEESSEGMSMPVLTESLGTLTTVSPVVAVHAKTSVHVAVSPHQATAAYPATSVNVMASPYPAIAPSVSPFPAVTIMEELTDGAWFVTSKDSKLWFELKAEDDEHSWSHTLGVEKSEINPFPGVGNVTFKLVREAGTITFTGTFDGQQGFGRFHFEADENYFKSLQQQGVEEADKRKISFFSLNIKKDYVVMVQRSGFPHITGRELLSFAAMHIDQEFLQYWKGSGLVDADDPRTLVSIKSMQIDKGYIEELKAAGYDHLTKQQLFSLKSQHIDGAYIRAMGRGKNNEPIPVQELVSYKAMKIDSGYINSLRKVGYTNLERHDITSLYSMHVTADFIKGFQDIGYTDIPVREIISLKSMGITPEFAKGFRAMGLKELQPRELSQLKAMNITPEFVKGFRDIGYEDITPSRLGSLKSMNITPEFVGEFKKIGFDNVPLNMLPSLKSMGVNAEYISKMREKGFVSKDLNKYIRLKQDFN